MATVTTADPKQPSPHDPAIREYIANGGKPGDQVVVTGNMITGYSATKAEK
jgi:hypothetical protein